jgi:hypothetical protein
VSVESKQSFQAFDDGGHFKMEIPRVEMSCGLLGDSIVLVELVNQKQQVVQVFGLSVLGSRVCRKIRKDGFSIP